MFAEQSTIVPLYPATQSAVEMIDVSEYSVAQVVEKLPMGLRFEMLLYNGGALAELNGEGPYTIFAPADNYFDYLPRQGFVGLTHEAVALLARHHIVPRLAIPLTEAGAGTYLTLAGTEISFTPRTSDMSAAVGDGFAIKGYQARNGVVYLVSRVLVPAEVQKAMSK